MSELFDKILGDLGLDWIIYNKQMNELLEATLFDIRALVETVENRGTLLIRYDKFISALKVHSYKFGDWTMIKEEMSYRDNSEMSMESRETLKALAARGKKSL